jgi:hypothetical protein
MRATVLATSLVALTVSTTAIASSDEAELFNGAYVSTAVAKDDEPHALFKGTEIRVRFEHRTGYDVVQWWAQCNRFGARVEIADRRLITERADGTLVACRNRQHRQDRWLTRFFASDPRWWVRQDLLKLTAGERVIKLDRRAARP